MSLIGANDDVAMSARYGDTITFNADVANIRGTTALRRIYMIVGVPNNLTATLNLVLRPPPASNAFTQAVQCRNAATGTTINAHDSFDCEIRLAQIPPAGGQLISFEVRDRLCLAAGSAAARTGCRP